MTASGIHAILYAFFDAEERLDRAAMRRQTEACLEAGVAGIAALGLATEVAKLGFDERRAVMDWVAEDVGGRVPVGFTIFGLSVAEQVAMVRAAEAAGAGWLILQPPAAGSYGAGEYLDFFSRVMEATALPVAIQNAPQYLGLGLSADDVARLMRRHANMTLIKAEGSAVEIERLIATTEGRLRVFNGRGGLEMIDSLRAGCSGFLLAPDVVDHAVAIQRLHEAGDEAAAAAAYARVAPSIVFVMQSIETLICYGKRLFAARAGLTVHDRAPALRPTEFGLDLVARHAAALGAFGRQG
ncbi:dihydrodipicolinate synthase family protein [Inquilinus sp. CA228]|uniref:dihydrodipicolinate synthase family protein n=1 Tax=Inquilinus sp. CA228 TaxID=3455609 RepID=UPI003F8CF9A2